MMLKEFAIYGLFDEYDYNVTLSGGSVTFIYSLNGFGKSTVMRLISDILNGHIDELENVAFKRIDLKFEDDSCLIVENDPTGLLIQMQKNELEEELSPEDIKAIADVLYISPDRTVITLDGDLVPSLDLYLVELAEAMRCATEDSGLRVPTAGRKKYSDEELEFRSKDLKAKLDFIKQAGLEPDMPSGYRFPPSRIEITEYRKDYEDLVDSLEDYVDRSYSLAESVIVFMDIINDVYINKEVYINEKNVLNVKMSNNTALPINKLSSGEKQMLIMTYLLLFRARPHSIVIMDEPEISLHVAWQQKLGRTVKDIARLRDLQILIATHSPQIIHDDWDMAVELKVDDDR